MPEKIRSADQLEADRKQREARDKKYHEKKAKVDEENKRRKARGRMTIQEEKRWPYLTKEERRVIEDRLERERSEMPLLSEKLGAKRTEDKIRYDTGQMTEAEKDTYEKNLPKMSAFQKLNPHLKYDDQGNPVYPEASLFEGQPGYHINMPTLTDDQLAFAEHLLPLVKKELPGLMKNLSALPTQDMFGHMTNPVLQGLLSASQGYNPNTMFPSQMQNQMNPGLEMILGQLGAQGGEYLGNKLSDLGKYAYNNAPSFQDVRNSIPTESISNLLNGLYSGGQNAYNYVKNHEMTPFLAGGGVLGSLLGLGHNAYDRRNR